MSPPVGTDVRLLLSVGTDFHPFHRLIDWTDEWLAKHPVVASQALIQYGSSHPPEQGAGAPLLSYPELQTSISHASVVVCHAGPATVLEVRRHGMMPICVARDPDRGEHIDNHQQRFARYLFNAGLVHLCESRQSYHRALDAAVARSVELPSLPTSAVPRGVTTLAEVVEGLAHRKRLPRR